MSVDDIRRAIEREQVRNAKSGSVVTVDGQEFYIWHAQVRAGNWSPDQPWFFTIAPPEGHATFPALTEPGLVSA